MTTSATARATLAATGIEVTRLCIGTAAWGLTSADHGITVQQDQAVAAALHVMDGPVNYLDTSNNYGEGEAERRIGLAIEHRGGLPDGFVLQTKLDRDPDTGSFAPDRLRRSLEESLERLGVDRVPVVLLHDPEHIGFDEAATPGGALDATVALKEAGLADAVGVGAGPASLLRQFVDTGALDVILTHNRLTLVDRTADALVDHAVEHGVAVLNAAVFAGGILADHPRTTDLYGYGRASTHLLASIDAMGRACARAGVPLGAAALQLSLRDARIASTVVGVASAEQADELLALADVPIADDLWAELAELAPRPDHWRRD